MTTPSRVFKYYGKYYTQIGNDIFKLQTKQTHAQKLQRLLNEKFNKPIKKQKPTKDLSNKANLVNQIGYGDLPAYGVTNIQINKIMKNLGAYKHGFLGTFASDEIDDLKLSKKKNNYMIVNVDPLSQPGEHWLVLEFDIANDKERQIILFDPLGNDPKYYDDDFYNNLKDGIDNIIANNHIPFMLKFKSNIGHQIQPTFDNKGNLSKKCGLYCIRYIIDRINGKSWKESAHIKGNKPNIDYNEKGIDSFKKFLLTNKYV